MTYQQSTLDDYDELSFGDSGYLRIPIRLAERYLTKDTKNEKAQVQAIGTHLQILIRSERMDMLIRTPINNWVTSKVYNRSLTGWTINLDRWKDDMITENDHIKVEIHAKQEF